MDEIDRKLVGTTEKMNSAKDQFQPDKFGRAKGFDQGSYSKYVASLGQIYGELLRTVEYFREVIKTWQKNDVLTNQTSFFEDEVLDSTPPSLPVEVDPHQAEKDAAKKKRLRMLVVIGTIGTTVFFMGIALLIVVTPEKLPELTVTPSPISLQNQVDQSQIKKRVDELEADIRAADPIEVGFPFPPINPSLFLDEPKRR